MLLTTLALNKNGYDLKGIYSLEEYYAKDLQGYYEAITIGDSHNYYLGRAEVDITKWVEYFVNGMAIAFKSVYNKAKEQGNSKDEIKILRELDAKQRQILNLFEIQKYVTSKDIADFFKFAPRTARQLATNWVNIVFLISVGEGKKALHYQYMTGKKAMVVLILEDPKTEMVYFNRVKKLGQIHGIDVEYVTPEILNIKDEKCHYVDCKCHNKKK